MNAFNRWNSSFENKRNTIILHPLTSQLRSNSVIIDSVNRGIQDNTQLNHAIPTPTDTNVDTTVSKLNPTLATIGTIDWSLGNIK